MRFSLGTKIFLLMSSLVLLFGVTSFLILSKMDSLWENLWYVREELNPSSNQMTQLAQTLRAIEESLENKPLSESDMARDFLLESGIFLKIREIGSAVEKSEAWGYLSDEEIAQIKMTSTRLSRMIFGNHFYLNIIETGDSNEILHSYIGKFEKPPDNETIFNMYAAEFLGLIAKRKFEDAGMLKNDILRMVTFLKKEITAGNFEVLQVIEKIYARLAVEKRNVKMILFSISAFALAASILALLMSMRVLRPVKDLIMAVRTVGSGAGETVISTKGTDEIAELAREFDMMLGRLKERELELSKKQEELLRAERLAVIGKMASLIAHEIRNPLNSITLNTDMLKEDLEKTGMKEPLGLCTSIMKEIERLNAVTEGYLSYARMPKPVLETEDIGKVTASLITFLDKEFKERGIIVENHLPDGFLVECDENQVRQAMLNILKNSIEAMKEGGKIIISGEYNGGFAKVHIIDSGSGIPEEIRGKIFEPFFSTKKKGTGLGLALVHQVMTEHGGTVDVKSEAGKGTTVILGFKI